MANRNHGFFEFKIGGLVFVEQLLSFLKMKEKEAKNVLKGVNTTNLNRKIKKAVTIAASPQDLDMNSFVKDKVLGGFKVRMVSKGPDHSYFNLGHPYITGRGATKLITKSSQKRANSITYAGMMSVLMYGRKDYYIPTTLRNSRKPMMWVNKPHYAGKSGYSGGCIIGRRLHIPAYEGIDYMEAASAEVEAWFEQIQEKFMSKGFNTINL